MHRRGWEERHGKRSQPLTLFAKVLVTSHSLHLANKQKGVQLHLFWHPVSNPSPHYLLSLTFSQAAGAKTLGSEVGWGKTKDSAPAAPISSVPPRKREL